MMPELSRRIGKLMITKTILGLQWDKYDDFVAAVEKVDAFDQLPEWAQQIVRQAEKEIKTGRKDASEAEIEKGGPGSGNWGHAGRPGMRGGSAPGRGRSAVGGQYSELAALVNDAPSFGSYEEAVQWRGRQTNPEFKTLQAAIADWQGADVNSLRSETKAILQGEQGTERARILLGSINGAKAASPVLHRGWNTDMDASDVVKNFSVGKTIDLDASSFSSSRNVANAFASGLLGRRGDTQVMFTLQEGAKALRLDGFAANQFGFSQKEWITSGRFEVTNVKRDGNMIKVGLRQVGTFNVK